MPMACMLNVHTVLVVVEKYVVCFYISCILHETSCFFYGYLSSKVAGSLEHERTLLLLNFTNHSTCFPARNHNARSFLSRPSWFAPRAFSTRSLLSTPVPFSPFVCPVSHTPRTCLATQCHARVLLPRRLSRSSWCCCCSLRYSLLVSSWADWRFFSTPSFHTPPNAKCCQRFVSIERRSILAWLVQNTSTKVGAASIPPCGTLTVGGRRRGRRAVVFFCLMPVRWWATAHWKTHEPDAPRATYDTHTSLGRSLCLGVPRFETFVVHWTTWWWWRWWWRTKRMKKTRRRWPQHSMLPTATPDWTVWWWPLSHCSHRHARTHS